MTTQVGFMQGRLLPPVNGQIQAFPASDWAREFPIAEKHGFTQLEWVVGDEYRENPLLMAEGRKAIVENSRRFGLTIPSLTSDSLMDRPFWGQKTVSEAAFERHFDDLVEACSEVGIGILVVPLVDGGSMKTREDTDAVLGFFSRKAESLRMAGCRVAFEADLAPAPLAAFIDCLDAVQFGVNYDIGNSASLGYAPAEEFRAYGPRVINVHIKDRPLSGMTVPLGSGDADFSAVFGGLAEVGYSGNNILQTARDHSGNDVDVLCAYRDFVRGFAD